MPLLQELKILELRPTVCSGRVELLKSFSDYSFNNSGDYTYTEHQFHGVVAENYISELWIMVTIQYNTTVIWYCPPYKVQKCTHDEVADTVILQSNCEWRTCSRSLHSKPPGRGSNPYSPRYGSKWAVDCVIRERWKQAAECFCGEFSEYVVGRIRNAYEHVRIGIHWWWVKNMSASVDRF